MTKLSFSDVLTYAINMLNNKKGLNCCEKNTVMAEEVIDDVRKYYNCEISDFENIINDLINFIRSHNENKSI